MNLALCADDRMGLRINGRRQSKDRLLRERLMAMSAGRLRMSSYSARQFEYPVYAGEDYLSGAKDGDWCFCEDQEYLKYAQKIERLALFRWNRHYPADEYFQFPGKWVLVQTCDFPGSSHETITMEVYKPCE